MNESYYFLTTSGTSVDIKPIYSGPAENRDAVQSSFIVSTSTGPPRTVDVIFPTPPITENALKNEAGISFNEKQRDLAFLTVLSELEQSPEIQEDLEARHEIIANADVLLENLKRPKLSDREMRRYIVRKVYDNYIRTTLSNPARIASMDFWLTGSEQIDFIRNIEVLTEEDYLHSLRQYEDDTLSIIGTAKLVREFEKYGAAREDVVSQQDYEATLTNYPVLANYIDAILLEYRRYKSSITPGEIISVFRAIAPLVENLMRDMLKAQGCEKQFASLGPMISELQQRNLGSVALYSQLNHILKFGRDLAQHGATVSEPVLRIACENAFELIPQISAIFP